jgi:hypothetical protein
MSTLETVYQTFQGLQDPGDASTSSGSRFEDGGEYRVEIPSVESPAAFESVLEESERLDVPLHRVSQGSGISLLSDAEIRAYTSIGAAAGVEVCLFSGPRAPWNGVASAMAPEGGVFGWRLFGVGVLRAALDEVFRVVDLGIRSVLVADEGLLALVCTAREQGHLPKDLVIKVSALMGIANPVQACLLGELGADSINIASDTPIAEIAAFRAMTSSSLDIYIEGPDGLGGFLRYHELGPITRVGAPVYLKFGLRNAPNLYPTGGHLRDVESSTVREKVRRAALGLERLQSIRPDSVASASDKGRRGVPVDS